MMTRVADPQTIWIIARATGVASLVALAIAMVTGSHRLSYLAFATAFLHAILSGTDLAYPWLTGVAWLVAAVLAIAGTRRVLHAVPARA